MTDTLGLNTQEALERLEKYGANRLPETPLPGVGMIFLRQFLSPFIYILFIAALASLLLNQIPNTIFIFAVLLLNAVIGTIQEFSAQKAAAALKQLVVGDAHVIRDGEVSTINAEELVPGDCILLTSGDKIPADIKLDQSFNLSVDESLLTGESMAVTKNSQCIQSDDIPTGDMVNHCFAGSIVVHGRGRGIVTATAAMTKLGQIAHHVTRKRVSEPPLMIRVKKFTYQVALAIILAIFALVIVMYLRGGYNLTEMVMMTIGLAVSTIPEGLPAALTVALAIGMRRMANHNVIIRKLVAVESLGSCTYICSDKTGTLTVNQLTIRKILLPDGREYNVTGEGVSAGGKIEGEAPEVLIPLCLTGLLANESHLNYSGTEWTGNGDIVDISFLVLAKKLGLSVSQLRNKHKQLGIIPYESENAFSGSLNTIDGEKACLHIKGSPEKLQAMCTYMDSPDGPILIDQNKINHQFEELAQHGYRIIALAQRITQQTSIQDIEQPSEMVFLGMVAMIDPVRPEAKEAIQRCQSGQIHVAMVTGDHPLTAKAIAQDIGLYKEDDLIVTGSMIKQAAEQNDDALDDLVKKSTVFARIEPNQKEQIVESLLRNGHLVAVTGDGVNDAPAMRRSNVGIAMGKRGTDVAKETADLIITDDKFSSIVDGIEQGRIVYNNIRKVIGLLIATGFSALLLFLCTVLAGLPMPLTAIQLLWLNLIANGLQDVALAFEPKEGNELDKPPRRPSEPIFEKHIISHVLVSGTTMGLLAFAVYVFLVSNVGVTEDARNLTLMLMVIFGNIHALSSRSETRSIFSMNLLSNPFLICAVPLAQLLHITAMYIPGLSDVLGLKPISLLQWFFLFAIAMIFLLVEEIHKYITRKRNIEIH